LAEAPGRAFVIIRWFPFTTLQSCMKLFRHLRRKYLAISVGSSTHFQKHFDHCPHCEEKTPWMARVMSGYYRCLQCGNDPLVAESESASRTDAASSAPERSSEAGGTGRDRRLSA